MESRKQSVGEGMNSAQGVASCDVDCYAVGNAAGEIFLSDLSSRTIPAVSAGLAGAGLAASTPPRFQPRNEIHCHYQRGLLIVCSVFEQLGSVGNLVCLNCEEPRSPLDKTASVWPMAIGLPTIDPFGIPRVDRDRHRTSVARQPP